MTVRATRGMAGRLAHDDVAVNNGGCPYLLAVVIDEEDILPVVAALRDVMRAMRDDRTGDTGHGGKAST